MPPLDYEKTDLCRALQQQFCNDRKMNEIIRNQGRPGYDWHGLSIESDIGTSYIQVIP